MEPFKNMFSAASAKRLAAALRRKCPGFPQARFLRGIGPALEPLELKSRMQLIADRIETCAGADPPELFVILRGALAADEKDTEGLRGFEVWPLTELVARRGLDHFEESMRALEEMTIRFTAEFAIRPFLRIHTRRTLKVFKQWTSHPNAHVRRLVSEGSRPLLPWGERLSLFLKEPQHTLPLLDALFRDPSEYVRRSVSNHLNDFSRTRPDVVLDTLTRWRYRGGKMVGFDKLARHASRSLLKAGHAGVLEFHGFSPASALELTAFRLLDPRARIGGRLRYVLSIRNRSKQRVSVLFDYAIHHRKSNGTMTRKVFKGRKFELAPCETREIEGSHSFRLVTTRTYHPGLHRMEPLLNGKAWQAADFDLTA